MGIVIDLDKAKLIGHDMRRAAREAEFTPLDKQATIPMYAEQAEADRQGVREKYAAIQTVVDAAETPDGIKAALNGGQL